MADTLDMTPGPQVPLSTTAALSAAAQGLAAGAYHDDPVTAVVGLHENLAGGYKNRWRLMRPNMGEAFSVAVTGRMLGAGRKPLIQAPGVNPEIVLGHCLSAIAERRRRDGQLAAIMLVFGVLFLPGALLWLGAFQLRAMTGRGDASQAGGGFLRQLPMVAMIGLTAVLLLVPPFTGPLSWYARFVTLAPVLGALLAHRVCLRSSQQLRARWKGLLDGSLVGSTTPTTVPTQPGDRASRAAAELKAVEAEQRTNYMYYAGDKGILGVGPRRGYWTVSERIRPADDRGVLPFQTWDLTTAIKQRLADLRQTPFIVGDSPRPEVEDWLVESIGAGAGEVTRPKSTDVQGYRISNAGLQAACNEQRFGGGPRHYVATQYQLFKGQLVVTLLTHVSRLHDTLRIDVSLHVLGPVHGLFTTAPAVPEKTVPDGLRPWKERKVQLPIVTWDEVIRLCVRATLFWAPHIRDWLGGRLPLPEPFGLRHAWATSPAGNRFMADDVERSVAPVVRAVLEGVVQVLRSHNVDVTPFVDRLGVVNGTMQSITPGTPDTVVL
ncbi:hypothetical protein [Allostreptomyces psammosilenae]|uniref:Uncharacterized protein n=1 Tax=Allostreptomyces psammosilenae TaxID=1892865 RepID=A0A852ZRG1_9ACTN|nr:hypothetical protein [Allostreptomyces psammosilenae]NYI05036.1 hypothetical protein [Allostreptomyces psammosilenae]